MNKYFLTSTQTKNQNPSPQILYLMLKSSKPYKKPSLIVSLLQICYGKCIHYSTMNLQAQFFVDVHQLYNQQPP